MSKELLEELRVLTEVDFISSLSHVATHRLLKALHHTASEGYTSKEWKDAYQFLTRKKIRSDDGKEIRELLIQHYERENYGE